MGLSHSITLDVSTHEHGTNEADAEAMGSQWVREEKAKNRINTAVRSVLNFDLTPWHITFLLVDLYKSGHIHSWYVDNVLDGDFERTGDLVLEEEDATKLLEAINKVLENPTKEALEKHLPMNLQSDTRPKTDNDGVRIGDNAILEGHLKDLRETKEGLEKGLKVIADNPDLDISLTYNC